MQSMQHVEFARSYMTVGSGSEYQFWQSFLIGLVYPRFVVYMPPAEICHVGGSIALGIALFKRCGMS